MAPRMNGSIRWLVRRPAMKVTKTGCVDCFDTLAAVVRMLFPELVDSAAWQVYIEGEECGAGAVACDVQRLVIEWKGYRPLTPCEVTRLCTNGRSIAHLCKCSRRSVLNAGFVRNSLSSRPFFIFG